MGARPERRRTWVSRCSESHKRQQDPRVPLKGLYLPPRENGRLNKFSQFKDNEWEEFLPNCVEAWKMLNVHNRDDYNRVKNKVCTLQPWRYLMKVCPFAWSGTQLGVARFGELLAANRVLQHQAHRAQYTPAQISAITAALSPDVAARALGQEEPSWDGVMGHTGLFAHFGEMVDAKPDESFNDVFDRLGEMICVCTQMTEDHAFADDA